MVTFNYRLNIFGQPNAPQLVNSSTGSQNFGLLDIDAAVDWVHDNIANFGGDPNRIIIFGQSAGGVATDAYTFSHPDSTFVKGADRCTWNITGYLLNSTLQVLSSIPAGEFQKHTLVKRDIFYFWVTQHFWWRSTC